jgi:DNA-binding MarR family transcriptional regulator
MLRSLEEIGLVSRRRCSDRRKRWVQLTETGLDRLRDAARCLARASRRLLCLAICFGGGRKTNERLHHLHSYESYLDGLRAQFGDMAWIAYRWDADYWGGEHADEDD